MSAFVVWRGVRNFGEFATAIPPAMALTRRAAASPGPVASGSKLP
jgi:hypothetical protein